MIVRTVLARAPSRELRHASVALPVAQPVRLQSAPQARDTGSLPARHSLPTRNAQSSTSLQTPEVQHPQQQQQPAQRPLPLAALIAQPPQLLADGKKGAGPPCGAGSACLSFGGEGSTNCTEQLSTPPVPEANASSRNLVALASQLESKARGQDALVGRLQEAIRRRDERQWELEQELRRAADREEAHAREVQALQRAHEQEVAEITAVSRVLEEQQAAAQRSLEELRSEVMELRATSRALQHRVWPADCQLQPTRTGSAFTTVTMAMPKEPPGLPDRRDSSTTLVQVVKDHQKEETFVEGCLMSTTPRTRLTYS